MRFLNHDETALCVNAERSVNKIFGGDCHTPIGAHAKIIDGQLQLSAMLGDNDGKNILRASQTGQISEGDNMAAQVAEALLKRSR